MRRTRGENLEEDNYQGHVAHGGGSVHILGAIRYQGKPDICVLDQNVTGRLYLNILQNNLVPNMRQYYGNNWILVGDNAISHRANLVQGYLATEDITRLEWPPYNPDMNPIENRWYQMGQTLEEVDAQSYILRELGPVLHTLWQKSHLNSVRPSSPVCLVVCAT